MQPTLESIQSKVFTVSCALSGSCHSTGSTGTATPAGRGLNLADGQSHASLVNVESTKAGIPRVIPGDPAGSLLVRVLEGSSAGISQMPLGNTALPEDTIEAIKQWVADGAAP